MKRIFTLFLFFLATISAKADTYTPLVDNNTVWLVRQGVIDTFPNFWYYGFNGEDTVINTVTYRKLFQSPDTNFSSAEYFMAIREDIATEQVFVYTNGAERILYDFSLNVGDTLGNTIDGYGAVNNLECIVHSIDSILIGGVYRKHIHFRPFGDTSLWVHGSWVEGIGNLTAGGLLGSATMIPLCDCGEHLICHKNSGSWQYHNPAYISVDCDAPVSVVSVNALSKDGMKATLYPNPVNRVSYLKFVGDNAVTRVDVYDITGRIVKSDKPVNGQIMISKEEYVSGCYLYRLFNDDGKTVTGRFTIE